MHVLFRVRTKANCELEENRELGGLVRLGLFFRLCYNEDFMYIFPMYEIIRKNVSLVNKVTENVKGGHERA